MCMKCPHVWMNKFVKTYLTALTTLRKYQALVHKHPEDMDKGSAQIKKMLQNGSSDGQINRDVRVLRVRVDKKRESICTPLDMHKLTQI